ncbi:MAG: NYN domain-containing protein [Planctomycetota bacterium]
MFWIVDGYNLLHACDRAARRLEEESLEAAREELLGLLADYSAGGGRRVVIVFDGPEDGDLPSGPSRPRGLRVVFSRGGRSADDEIAHLVERHPRPAEIAVASSDRAVQRQAKRLGAAVYSSDEFLREVFGTLGAGGRRGSPEPRGKTAGLTAAEAKSWKAWFGMDDAADIGS